MSDTQPTPADPGTPRTSTTDGPGTAAPTPTTPESAPPGRRDRSAGGGSGGDPLRGSRTSGMWLAVVASGIILVLLIIFIAQNTDPASIRFLGWEGETPLAVALLIATVAGLFLATAVGSLRILQLRRRVRRGSR